jgi:hypothetical protein
MNLERPRMLKMRELYRKLDPIIFTGLCLNVYLYAK